ncbi:MAG: YihY/virulence factor BrkB family protein [Patescibacteria group bacterium]
MAHESLIELLKQTFKAWKADQATRLSAALSFYAIFSLVPVVLILVAILGSLLDRDSVQQLFIAQLQDNIGQEGAAFIASALKTENILGPNLFISLVTIGSLIISAIGIFGHLKTSFNIIWHKESEAKKGFLEIIREHGSSFGIVIVIGLLFIVSLLLSASVTVVTNFFQDNLPFPQLFIQLLNQSVAFGILTVLFATLFKLLPDKKIQWTDVWEGAIFTATLFVIGKFFIGFYITNAAIATRYGAAGSLIVILLWIYYSTQILFFGAELTKVYTYTYGSLKEEPKKEVTKTAIVVGSFLEGFIKAIFKRH